ncbi:hypothetical protein PsorP6_009108 [Peronosclerospora sorghi]|uniref:Uncharacterized protein n=1 Tax=Peronosclerospora sorghi TaxID=230839 RepID=A0ACC0W0K6_9STRA|nr:hypothetical protein PsorP6_009108 [Peronosclerospora sorghi]
MIITNVGDVSKSDDGDVSRQSNVGTNVVDVSKSDDGDVSRQSSVGTNETNKSQEETSVENEADENDFENDLNQSMHSGDGTSRNGDENGDGYSVSVEFGLVYGENPDQKVDDDQQHEDSSDRNENESSKSVDGGIRVQIGPRGPSDLERVIIPEYLRKRNQSDDTSSENDRNSLGEQSKARRTGLRLWSERHKPARYRSAEWMNAWPGQGGTRGNMVYASLQQQPEDFETDLC